MKTKKSEAKQEMKPESPTKWKMEMDEIWLWVKEIKEELEKDMMSGNFEGGILTQGVMMKEEVEVDAEGTQACSSLHGAKRRRLTGEDLQKILKAENPRCPNSVEKKQGDDADGVKVSSEENKLESSEIRRMEAVKLEGDEDGWKNQTKPNSSKSIRAMLRRLQD